MRPQRVAAITIELRRSSRRAPRPVRTARAPTPSLRQERRRRWQPERITAMLCAATHSLGRSGSWCRPIERPRRRLTAAPSRGPSIVRATASAGCWPPSASGSRLASRSPRATWWRRWRSSSWCRIRRHLTLTLPLAPSTPSGTPSISPSSSIASSPSPRPRQPSGRSQRQPATSCGSAIRGVPAWRRARVRPQPWPLSPPTSPSLRSPAARSRLRETRCGAVGGVRASSGC